MITHERLTFRRFVDALFMVMITSIGGVAVLLLASMNERLSEQAVQNATLVERLNNHGTIIKTHDDLIKENTKSINSLVYKKELK